MNRQRNRHSFVSVTRARRIRPPHAASRLGRSDHRRPGGPAADAAALAFLSEILIGDRAWSMAEVERLISLRESAQRGRWRVAGTDEGASRP